MATFFRIRTFTEKIIECCTIAILLGLLVLPFFASGQTAPETVIDAAVSADTITDTAASENSDLIEETVPEDTQATIKTDTSTDVSVENTDTTAADDMGTADVESALPDTPSFPDLCAETGVLTHDQFVAAVRAGTISYQLTAATDTGIATAAVVNTTGCTAPMSLSVYKMFDQVLSHQEYFDGTGSIDVSADTALTATLPTCMAQIDLWYGDAPQELLDSNPYASGSVPAVLAWKYIHNEAGKEFYNAVGDFCQHEEEPPVANMCMAPDALGDETADDIRDSGEPTVQEILDDNGYSDIDATDDQRQYQLWHVTAGQEVTVSATFLDKYAGHSNVFGYYVNGDASTFVPLFRKGSAVGDTAIPEASNGSNYSFTVPDGATTLGFMIKSYDGDTLASTIATEAAISTDGNDNVVVYNSSADSYILGFEDLIDGDFDFNDMVVMIHLDCADTADTGGNDTGGSGGGNGGGAGDDGGTGGGSLQCIDGLDNDSDGLIDSEDPGCHADNDASNAASYDATDDDETDIVPAAAHHSSRHHSSGSNASVPSSPAVLGAQACTEYIHSYIKLGHQNNTEDVSRLQTFLNEYMGDHLAVTGFYDITTYDALKAFQMREKSQVLVPWVGVTLPNADQGTGWLYKTTKRWINMIKCPELNLPIPELTIDPQDL